MNSIFSFRGRSAWKSICAIAIVVSLGACQPFSKGSARLTTTTPCVALALPASGPHAAVGNKIKRGAEAALAALKSRGVTAQLVTVDTSNGNWLQRIAALPEAFAVVGGPLGEANYTAARKAGILDKRLFFAFMPTLSQGEEGRLAWRFFPSPQDQVDALVACATDGLNIRSYGAFYPDDAYGRRMVSLLEQTLARKHMTLAKASYNPNAPASWTAAVRPLINPHLAQDGKTPVPQTAFEAIFLPDSWKHMNQVTTSLLNNGEDRLILLGTTLWEQGMRGKGGRVALGIFPMAWNSTKVPASLRNNCDFWTALGYEFMNFACRLGLPARPENLQDVNERIQQAAPGMQVLAPIRWDTNGVAHQTLSIYQVTPAGAAPLNASSFQQSRQAQAERTALRLQSAMNPPEPSEAEAAPMSDEPPYSPPPARPAAAVTPPQAPAPTVSAPMSPTVPSTPLPGIEQMPHTSYKLSLPVKR